jgi:hypothetical protein
MLYSVMDNVDPRLLVAIAQVETHFGADNCKGVAATNNPFCILNPNGTVKTFSTIGDSIQYVANLLAGKIGPDTTLANLYKPGGGLSAYCNTPECNPGPVGRSMGAQGWTGNGGPGGIYGPLQSPCFMGSDGAYYEKDANYH